MSKRSEAERDVADMTMVMLNLPADERRVRAEATNAAMACAMASGAEPNAWLREQFTGDLVLGLWEDPTEPGGVAVAALKGHGRLMLISQGTRSVPMVISAIRCTCAEEAEAMCRTFGDGRAKIKS